MHLATHHLDLHHFNPVELNLIGSPGSHSVTRSDGLPTHLFMLMGFLAEMALR